MMVRAKQASLHAMLCYIAYCMGRYEQMVNSGFAWFRALLIALFVR